MDTSVTHPRSRSRRSEGQRQPRQGDDVEWIMVVSRVVWEHVVLPEFVAPSHDRGVPLTVAQCCSVLGVAEALFPLVPRACRAIMGSQVAFNALYGSHYGMHHASRYFALKCAGEAGIPKCISWIVGGKSTRNNRRECVVVLRGLCAGGHLGMAKELVASGEYNPWTGSLWWPVGDPDLIEDLKEISHSKEIPCSVLYDACKGGNLDVVKWVMSTFEGVGTKPWELPMPFFAAVRWGHLDVVKWLASSTRAFKACKKMAVHQSSGCQWVDLIASVSLDVVKFCAELFCGVDGDTGDVGGCTPGYINDRDILQRFIYFSGSNFEEGCQWLKEKFSVSLCTAPELYCATSVQGLKWILQNYSVEPSQEILRIVFSKIADEELIQWLVKFFPSILELQPTPGTFARVCGNKRDSVEMVKCLFPKTGSLTPRHRRMCLLKALSRSNTAVADWLETTLHVMAEVNATPIITEGTFKRLCGSKRCGLSGVKWFLSKCTVSNLREEALIDAVEESQIQVALFLLGTFDVSVTPYVIQKALASGTEAQVKQPVPHGKQLDAAGVAEALSHCVIIHSGKAAKWLIQHFHVNESQVKMSNNHLLGVLMANSKKKCAEWLIQEFHVTLEEIGTMGDTYGYLTGRADVGTWKMMLRVFPEIDGSFAIRHLRELAGASPLHQHVSMEALGITKADITMPDSTLWSSVWVPQE
ncbi:hypothetical protein Pelo_8312 [Pelomyxa schiedti]|nr:hypothetical protein Pelo_8312 [Pelomyxa schiedti]